MASANSNLPDPSVVREVFSYDHESGEVSRLVGGRLRRYDACGSGTRYRRILVLGKMVPEHHIAWVLIKGVWPSQLIDHINGDTHDNRACNLREVSASENCQNQRKPSRNNKSSGLLGVARRQNGKWDARITVSGRVLHVGCFKTAEEAHQAYLVAKRKLHAGCTI